MLLLADSEIEETIVNYSTAAPHTGPFSTSYNLPKQKSYKSLQRENIFEMRRNLDPAFYADERELCATTYGKQAPKSRDKARGGWHKLNRSNQHTSVGAGKSIDLSSRKHNASTYITNMNSLPFQKTSKMKRKRVFRGGARGAMALKMEKEEEKRDDVLKAYSIECRSQEKNNRNRSRM